MYTSDNRILYSLSRLVLNRFAAIGSQYGVTSILQPVCILGLKSVAVVEFVYFFVMFLYVFYVQ